LKLFIKKIFFKVKNLEDFLSLENKPIFLHCSGYWQDISLLDSFKEEFKIFINKKLIEFDMENYKIHPNSTMIHVRRSDYLKLNEDLRMDYYQNAMSPFKRNMNKFMFDIYTDDPTWVLEQEDFRPAKNIYKPSSVQGKNANKDALENFLKMLFYENYILSNSTYSLLAYEFSFANNKQATAPEPWFRNRGYGEIYPNNCYKIQNLE
jgi:hypothetical protein